MRKKVAGIVLAAALAAALNGCNAVDPAMQEETSENKVTGGAEKTPEEQKKPEVEPEAEQEEKPEDMWRVYQDVLQQLAFEHLWPDGSEAVPEDMAVVMEENKFAVFDIDGDEKEELIIAFSTAPMAGMCGVVYGYQETDGTLRAQLAEFPALTFYDNGLVKAELSHNMGLSDDTFWPYRLFRYDAKEDCYVLFAEVDAWSKKRNAVNDKGDPYPDDVDTMHAGQVYIVAQDGEIRTINRDDYEEFVTTTFAGATETVIPFQDMSEENIKAVWQEHPEGTK